MLPLHIVETEQADFDEPVVELWREDEFVGMVFWDGEASVVEIYPDADGDVYDIEVGELIRVLDLAVRIVTPEGIEEDEYLEEGPPGGPWVQEPESWAESDDDGGPLAEFAARAVFRTDDGEGFYDRATAEELIARCDELRLAIVGMDGFDLDGEVLIPRPEMQLSVAAPGIDDWGVLRAAANGQARDTLASWPARPTLVIAFVVRQRDGETIVA
jgi:hypothetical protein